MYVVRQIGETFAASVSGVNSSSASPDEVRLVSETIRDYAVVVLPKQTLNNETQAGFAKHFGELEQSGNAHLKDKKYRKEAEGVIDVSNLGVDNKPRSKNDDRRLQMLQNLMWHADASFRKVPIALSMLYAHVVPEADGETEFADLRAAYDDLNSRLKDKVDSLIAEHWFYRARFSLGFEEEVAPEAYNAMPPVPQRLVRFLPDAQRKTLYLGSHASHIVGMPVPEGRLLLQDLLEHATQRRYVYSHSWKAGDLVIWDNRCTLHRGRPFDETKIRDLRRVSTRDVASTLEQAA